MVIAFITFFHCRYQTDQPMFFFGSFSFFFLYYCCCYYLCIYSLLSSVNIVVVFIVTVVGISPSKLVLWFGSGESGKRKRIKLKKKKKYRNLHLTSFFYTSSPVVQFLLLFFFFLLSFAFKWFLVIILLFISKKKYIFVVVVWKGPKFKFVDLTEQQNVSDKGDRSESFPDFKKIDGLDRRIKNKKKKTFWIKTKQIRSVPNDETFSSFFTSFFCVLCVRVSISVIISISASLHLFFFIYSAVFRQQKNTLLPFSFLFWFYSCVPILFFIFFYMRWDE